MNIWLIILSCSLLITTVSSQNCLVDGICSSGSFSLGEATFVNSSVTCRNLCRNSNNPPFECNYYAYCSDETCYGFNDCLAVDPVGGCKTAPADCDYCGVDGYCQGPQLDRLRTDEFTCWNMCNNDLTCKWYIYNPVDTDCILLDNCDYYTEDSCPDCKVSEKTCPPPGGSTVSTTRTSTTTTATSTTTSESSGNFNAFKPLL